MALTDLASNVPSSLPTFPGGASNYNPVNLIPNARGYLDTLANAYILKPANAQGLAGFVFDYEGETTLRVQSEISDHFTEQNTFVNDQAAQKPQRVILRGFVAEIMLNTNLGLIGVLNTLQNKLSTLPAILGKYTPSIVGKIQAGVTSATSVVDKMDSAISRVQNVVGLVTGSSAAPTKQQQAYQKLFALWSNNTVFTLNTPFNYFKSMMIEDMSFTQDELTKEWSEISVTVKEVRFVQGTPTTAGLSPQQASQTLQGRLQQQGQAQTNQGGARGSPFSLSRLFPWFGHVTQAPIGG